MTDKTNIMHLHALYGKHKFKLVGAFSSGHYSSDRTLYHCACGRFCLDSWDPGWVQAVVMSATGRNSEKILELLDRLGDEELLADWHAYVATMHSDKSFDLSKLWGEPSDRRFPV